MQVPLGSVETSTRSAEWYDGKRWSTHPQSYGIENLEALGERAVLRILGTPMSGILR